MAALDDLLDAIFDGAAPALPAALALRAEFGEWLRASRRFRAFAESQQVKMRAKLRGARDEGGLLDLRAELEAAAVLLRDERFTLEYEKYAASRRRGPDFTVTFRTHTPLNVEVRRIRPAELGEPGAEGGSGGEPLGKLIAVLCDKAGQLLPGSVNLLWLAAERGLSPAGVDRAAAALRLRAERKDEEFFARRGFQSAAHFLRHYQRLSGVVVYQPGAGALWLNPLARHAVSPQIAAALARLAAG
jgi:hypothetical protein